MFAHLPSLNGLRVFEAAARHLSFKLAAKELGLTPTAVSHQIRNLETQLQLPLFVRHTRAVELTDAGQTLFDSCRQLLRQLDQTLAGLGVGSQALRIATEQGIAALWLQQQLPYFQRRYPDIQLSVSQSAGVQDAHLCLRRASDQEQPLLPERFGVYASPTYLALKRPQQTLMQMRRPAKDDGLQWQHWQGVYGKFRDATVLEFDREDLLLQACLASKGLALTSSLLVASQLEQGWLTACFPDKTLAGPGLMLELAPATSAQRQVRLFQDWLGEQAGLALAP